MSHASNFGVQSYCFRNFKDNAAVAKMVREIGLDSIELCAVHADLDDPKKTLEAIKPYQDAGIKIVSIGVQTFRGEAKEAAWFDTAHVCGAKHISCHFTVDTFSRVVPNVAKMAGNAGVKVGLHCHGGYMFGGSPDEISHILEIGGPNIGVTIDTAWCMQIGPHQGNPVKWAEKYAGRITGIHFKDFTFAKNAMWTDVVVGTGNLDLPAFVKALDAAKFDGMAVIEYEADPESPVGALTNCVKSMRAAM